MNHSARNQGRAAAELAVCEAMATSRYQWTAVHVPVNPSAALVRELGAEKVARLFGLDATEGEAWNAALRDYAEAFTETLREAAR